MVAYSFRPQFEDSILSGRKRQTIRAIGRRRHAQAGDALQLYTGMRTSACRLLARSVCKSTHEVSIVFSGDGIDDNVWLHGIRFGDLTGFAQADGFKAWPVQDRPSG